MDKAVAKRRDTSLYERDFYAWLREQAKQLRQRSHNEIDWDNLAEEIESVGRSEKREIVSRLERLIQHLLKWQFQPGRRNESWRITIGEQRTFIDGIIDTSPSLKSFPKTVFEKAYAGGRREVIRETGMLPSVFPAEPSFTVAQALDPTFFPGAPFEPHEIIRD